jgi:cell division protein FtsI (penicillin-binding protein 3)
MKDRKRIIIVAVFLSLLFCALIVRFYQIQIIEGDKWTQIALSQHQYIVNEPFMRGSFYSNTSIKAGHPEDEQPFVVDIPKFHLFIDPDSIPESFRDTMAEQLCAHLQVPVEKKGKIRSEFDRKSRSRKLFQFLNREQRQIVEQWWSSFSSKSKIVRNALYFTSEYKRSYPFGSMLGTVLHTVQDEKDPITGQAVPTGGLELLYHSYLQGKGGKRLILRSPRRPLDLGKMITPPENGADIFLTVNHYLQAITESELAKGVKDAGAKGGWAVMMDPFTGEILALAQNPSFDPTRYKEYYNDAKQLECTRSKVVTECFEPGSIFKPITVAICMKANEELIAMGRAPLFSPDEKISTSNGWFPGRSAPLKDARVHSYLNMYLALQKSSNIYMAKIVQRTVDALGDAWYRRALSEYFGFGQKTNIELPGESGGLLPTPKKLHPNGKPEWSLPTPYSLAIGYNVLVNSIQMVKAYAMFANGGYAVDPHLVRKIVKKMPDGTVQVIEDHTQRGPGRQVLSKSIVDSVVCGLKYITKEGGTSKRADIMGYTEAGKSGTSEKIIDGNYSKVNHVASFVGFAPAKNPRFVLLVSVDDPEVKFIPGVGKHQFGGVCAAPIFREIATKALAYLGVSPDDPYGYPHGDPRRDPKKADWQDEVASLKALYDQWNGTSL